MGRVVPGRGRDGGRACPGHLISRARRKKKRSTKTTTTVRKKTRGVCLCLQVLLAALCVGFEKEEETELAETLACSDSRKESAQSHRRKSKGKMSERVWRWGELEQQKNLKASLHCSLSLSFSPLLSLFLHSFFTRSPGRRGALFPERRAFSRCWAAQGSQRVLFVCIASRSHTGGRDDDRETRSIGSGSGSAAGRRCRRRR